MTDNSFDLDSLPLEQLHRLQQAEETRLNAITTHYATLRASAVRFQAAKTALEATQRSSSYQKDILIPLTESLYVPGKIRDRDSSSSTPRVMVELGTGFYVEKTVKDAQALLDRKIKLVDVNSDNIREVIMVTRRNLENVQIAMQGKLMEIRAKQEGVRHRVAAETAAGN